ncbi:MAG: hypothetical protein WCB26_01405, partial [Pseudolabrys sp.]
MAFDLRMQALQRAQQSRNKTSNSEQAIQRLHSHFAFGEWLYCRPTQNEDGDETDEKITRECGPECHVGIARL